MVRPPPTSLFPRPRAIRPPGQLPRLFHSSSPSRSALFNLGGLATSRESQYLSKEHGIPRTEYSSNIHLIRSSEVDPFPNAPGATKNARLTEKNPALASTKYTPAAVNHVDALKKRHRVESIQSRGQGLSAAADTPPAVRAAAVRDAIRGAPDAPPRAATEHVAPDAYLQRLVRNRVEDLSEEVRDLKLTVERLRRRNNEIAAVVVMIVILAEIAGWWFIFRTTGEDAAAAVAVKAAAATPAVTPAAQAEVTAPQGSALQESVRPVQHPAQGHPDQTSWGFGKWLWSSRSS